MLDSPPKKGAEKLDIHNLTITKLAEELWMAAGKCPKCQGAREHPFISRGRENLVPCLQCEPLYKILEPIEAALEILRES
jgi:hypothetical protein